MTMSCYDMSIHHMMYLGVSMGWYHPLLITCEHSCEY